jgi:tetratricopeptide (TPR) repeat protein
MFHAVRTLFFLCALGCAGLGVAAQNPGSVGGGRGDLVIETDNSQSYAVYIPLRYDAARASPIIYCFDPMGRGSVAVERFRQAADKYGYIVVGSNNSRNGLDGPALSSILKNLWDDTHRRFLIDEKRVLAAGFSGGARVAASFAYSCGGCVFGVIASGAGFPVTLPVNDKLPFLFFGAIGYDDYNFYELRELEKKLAAARLVYRIETFDGAHQWLNESLAHEALRWFEVRAMKAGRRTKDDVLIDDLFKTNERRADEHLAAKRYIEAASAYRGIIDDLGSWRDVSRVVEKVSLLDASPELKRSIRSDADQVRTQQQLAGELLTLVDELRDTARRFETLAAIREKIAVLKKKAASAGDDAQQRVARRTLNQVFGTAFESAVFRFEPRGQLDLAANNLEVAAEIAPTHPQVQYDRARIFALRGEKKKAFEALERAVELGIRDPARIRGEKSFASLQTDKRFMTLLEGLRD